MSAEQRTNGVSDGTILGNDVTIGQGSLIGEAGGEPVTIGDGAKIGPGAIIEAGRRIGIGAMIRPGAVVLQDVPPFAVVEGNPAMIVGYRSVATSELPEVIDVPGEIDVVGANFYRLKHVTDLRGSLSVAELGDGLPFVPKRTFFVFDVPNGLVRGEHAHRECEQLLIAVRGSIRALVDDGTSRVECILDSPTTALHMRAGVWGTQYRYSSDAVLAVFASHLYDSNDYIRTYDEFLRYKAETAE